VIIVHAVECMPGWTHEPWLVSLLTSACYNFLYCIQLSLLHQHHTKRTSSRPCVSAANARRYADHVSLGNRRCRSKEGDRPVNQEPQDLGGRSGRSTRGRCMSVWGGHDYAHRAADGDAKPRPTTTAMQTSAPLGSFSPTGSMVSARMFSHRDLARKRRGS